MSAFKPSIDETHNPWRVLRTEVKYANPWISVREDQVTNPPGVVRFVDRGLES